MRAVARTGSYRARAQPSVLVAARGTASTAQTATTAGMTPRVWCCTRLITGDGVGRIRIGLALDSVRRAYPVIRDTTVRPDVKQPPVRQVSVLMGSDTAVVWVQAGRVREVMLASRSFATRDSLGVGTTLKRLLGYAQPKGYGAGGQLIVATAAHCGLSFYVAGRFDGLPDGLKDSTVLRRLPPEALVDRVRIDGCEQGDEQLVEDDSTYDVVTDSVLLAATLWDMETERALDRTEPLARGSLVVVRGSGGDYSSETLIVARDGKVTEELTHGEDYDDGYFDIRREGSTLVVDASQSHLLLRGQPVTPELECPRGEWAGVRIRWDETTRRFVPDAPRCVKQRSE